MTKEIFLDAVTQLGSDTVERFIIAEERLERKHAKKRAVIKQITAAACLLLVAGIGISAALGFWKRDALPTDIENIAWCTESYQNVPGIEFSPWNGWCIDYALYRQLTSAEHDEYIAIRVTINMQDTFEFEGKTVREIQEEKSAVSAKLLLLEELSKEGYILQYGELLYTQGAPDGTRWSKELYDERVQYYGEELLSQYIVEHTFLHEKAETDIDNCLQTLEQLEEQCNRAINEQDRVLHTQEALAQNAEVFSDAGVCAVVKNDRLFIFVTCDQLKALQIHEKENYNLTFASRRSYEHVEGDIPTLDCHVTGFALDKFSVWISQSEMKQPESDKELIEMLNEMIRMGQFDSDRLYFSFYGNGSLSKDLFADMHCEELSVFEKYINVAFVSVLYENIDPETLKVLSQHPSVKSISVYWNVAENVPA